MNIGQARAQFIEARRALLAHSISSFDGDLGEMIVCETIGGEIMPPAFKDFDLKHPKYGRVQIKTRTLLDRANFRKNTETRAVVKDNRNFDYLAHLVLNRDLNVETFILVPLSSIRGKLDATKGKIKLQDSRTALDALDLTNAAQLAQKRIDLWEAPLGDQP